MSGNIGAVVKGGERGRGKKGKKEKRRGIFKL